MPRLLFIPLSVLLFLAIPARAQDVSTAAAHPEDTEVWSPVPAVVVPASATLPVHPPSDAIILFDGGDLDAWTAVGGGSPDSWVVQDGVMIGSMAALNIVTRRRFRDYQLHIEWCIPGDVAGEGQSRGNSGIFLASTGGGDEGYELQILDSFENNTYVNGMAGSIYKQAIPLANPSRAPGEWQTFDVVWTAPRFGLDGSLDSPATVTVFYNGVLIQNGFDLEGTTVYVGLPRYEAHGDSPIELQAHPLSRSPVSFRNIWIREFSEGR